jgi:hypothetical protein
MKWGKLSRVKKYGIVFFLIHLVLFIILSIFFLDGTFNIASLTLIFVDFPVFFVIVLGKKLLPDLFNNESFLKILYLIFGSVFWGIIGTLFGLTIDKIKHKK